MGQKKLFRFEAIKSFSNVFQMPEGMKGKWKEHFSNSNPIVLEPACGKGDYSVAMAKQFPDKNFIGVDIKGNRLYVGAKASLEHQINNVAFLRTQISDIESYFLPEEVQEIWITFPDPFLRKSKAKNRLTHPRFLSVFQKLLPQNARIHLKTDSTELYEYTLEVIDLLGCTLHENIDDIYGQGKGVGLLEIKTFYEMMHLANNKTIKYLQFSLPHTPISLD